MLLKTIFEQLINSELNHIYLADPDKRVIKEEDYSLVIPAINFALLELSKKFLLKTSEVYIDLYEHITDYTIHSMYSTHGGSSEPIKYVVDTVERPFNDNLVVILEVYNEDGQELLLNTDNARHSLFTPEYNVLQVPHPEPDNSLAVMYQAMLDPIVYTPPTQQPSGGIFNPVVNTFDPETLDIPISPAILKPLLALVGARLFARLPSKDAANDAANMMAQYELACLEVTEKQLINRVSFNDVSFVKTGWR